MAAMVSPQTRPNSFRHSVSPNFKSSVFTASPAATPDQLTPRMERLLAQDQSYEKLFGPDKTQSTKKIKNRDGSQDNLFGSTKPIRRSASMRLSSSDADSHSKLFGETPTPPTNSGAPTIRRTKNPKHRKSLEGLFTNDERMTNGHVNGHMNGHKRASTPQSPTYSSTIFAPVAEDEVAEHMECTYPMSPPPERATSGLQRSLSMRLPSSRPASRNSSSFNPITGRDIGSENHVMLMDSNSRRSSISSPSTPTSRRPPPGGFSNGLW